VSEAVHIGSRTAVDTLLLLGREARGSSSALSTGGGVLGMNNSGQDAGNDDRSETHVDDGIMES